MRTGSRPLFLLHPESSFRNRLIQEVACIGYAWGYSQRSATLGSTAAARRAGR